MTIIVPMNASGLSKMIAGERLTPESLLLLARRTLQAREDLGPPQFPGRPNVLVLDDQELLDSHAADQRGEKISGDKRRQLTYLGDWRVAIWDVEARAAKRLLALVDAYQEFARQDCVEEAETLRLVLSEEWGVDAREAPADLAWWQLRDWASERAKRFDLLPIHLRCMRAPRGGLSIPRASREREADGDEQRALRW